MPVNTAKVVGRRKVNYASYEELLADADRLSAGPIKTLGNWTAGQILRHVAAVMNASIDGFTFTFPWYMRVVVRPFRKRVLAGPMPAGFKLSPEGSRALDPPPTSLEEGSADLHAAVARLQRELNRAKNPMLGQLSKEEWDTLHLRHASLHMSFIIPLNEADS
jgi:hypothetical protein